AIVCRNRIEYVIAFFGAARSGAVLVNVSVLYSADELEYVLEKADIQALIFESEYATKVEAVAGRLSKLKHRVSIGSEVGGVESFESFIGAQPCTSPDVLLQESQPFCMTYTG